jgi:hypothetical protein
MPRSHSHKAFSFSRRSSLRLAQGGVLIESLSYCRVMCRKPSKGLSENPGALIEGGQGYGCGQVPLEP